MFRRSIPGILVVATLTGGCLRKDTTHTLYLSPDGALRWITEEVGVRSDEADPGARLAEEQAYIGSALIGAHPVALALRAVAADGPVRTTVIREERPFHVVTDAQFFRADRVFERLFKESGIAAVVTLDDADDRRRLRIRMDFTGGVQQRESAATVLLEDLEQMRFVMTEGRFVAGGGFDVPERTEALISREWMARLDEAARSRGKIELVLTWTLVGDAL